MDVDSVKITQGGQKEGTQGGGLCISSRESQKSLMTIHEVTAVIMYYVILCYILTSHSIEYRMQYYNTDISMVMSTMNTVEQTTADLIWYIICILSSANPHGCYKV